MTLKVTDNTSKLQSAILATAGLLVSFYPRAFARLTYS